MQPRQFVTVALLLWLLGAALRLTVLAVPPLIPVIQADLHLSGTEVGLLAGLPVILFAVAALPGSMLIARFGALRTLLFGLLLTAGGGGARVVAEQWWPDWRDPSVWRLGLIFASINSVYFGTNAFLPALLSGAGHSDLISGALTALNFGQLPASALMVVAAQRIERRVWP